METDVSIETAARHPAQLGADLEPLGEEDVRPHLPGQSAALVSIALVQSSRFRAMIGFSFTAELGHPASVTMSVTGHRNEMQMRKDYSLIDSVWGESHQKATMIRLG